MSCLFRPKDQSVAAEVPGPRVRVSAVCAIQLEYSPNSAGQQGCDGSLVNSFSPLAFLFSGLSSRPEASRNDQPD